METSIRATSAQLDQQFPDLGEVATVEKLYSVVASDFVENIQILTNELYPKYVAEITRVQTFLDDLNKRDESELSSKEQMQKELIRTLLKLMLIENSP